MRDVTRSFNGKQVLDRLSLEVPQGQSLVVMGPSGGGKTVLIKHLIGLLRPDSGQVLVAGEDLWAVSEAERNRLRRRFGMVFQEGALFDSMSVFDNIAFPLRRHTQMSAAQVRARVEECLELVHLPGTELRRPSELSTGMRRRVGFARAITLEPEILLFDEPTAGLDPVLVSVINGVIAELTRRLHVTSLTVTHDLQSARVIGDRIALLFRGRLVADAPPDRFFQLPDPVVRQFIEGRAWGPLETEELPT
jgi:phospholipid/cholesterol/gamma-HCH transport system ATP-binding protein